MAANRPTWPTYERLIVPSLYPASRPQPPEDPMPPASAPDHWAEAIRTLTTLHTRAKPARTPRPTEARATAERASEWFDLTRA